MSRLNLLPEEIKNEIVTSKKNAKLRQLSFDLWAIFIVLVAVYLVLAFYLYTQKDDALKSKTTAEAQINKQKDNYNKALDFYNRISNVKKIQSSATDWDAILKDIGDRVPVSIVITNLTLADSTSRSKMIGNAATDKDVAVLKENLAKSEYFQYVDIDSISKVIDPLQREVRNFSISFTLKNEKVKK